MAQFTNEDIKWLQDKGATKNSYNNSYVIELNEDIKIVFSVSLYHHYYECSLYCKYVKEFTCCGKSLIETLLKCKAHFRIIVLKLNTIEQSLNNFEIE